MKLNIQLNHIFTIYSQQPDKLEHICQLTSLCRAAGTDNISLCLDADLNQAFSPEELKLIRMCAGDFFTLRIPLKDDYIKQAIILKPDMIIFYDSLDKINGEPQPLQSVVQTDLEDAILNLEANSIPTGMLIQPRMEILKEINKTSLDWVELSVDDYTTAVDSNDEMAALQKISSFATMARKMGFGLTAIGNIRQKHIQTLKKIEEIEEISFCCEFWDLALRSGIQKSVEILMLKFSL